MKSIVYVGMDVHSSNYTLSCYMVDNDKCFATVQVEPDYKEILKYLDKVQKNVGEPCEFHCGYEAGCLGYSLYHQLVDHGIDCTILASSPMPMYKRNEIKTDKRDAHKLALKKVKQQILAFCLRYDFRFTTGKSYWTVKHLTWLKSLEMDVLMREILDEYLQTYQQLTDKLERFDKRIEELAGKPAYAEKVKKLSSLIGIRTHTALALIVETGDFTRFAKANQYAAFLGLVPGEQSSGDKQNRTGITKAGNTHLRRLLTEAA